MSTTADVTYVRKDARRAEQRVPVTRVTTSTSPKPWIVASSISSISSRSQRIASTASQYLRSQQFLRRNRKFATLLAYACLTTPPIRTANLV